MCCPNAETAAGEWIGFPRQVMLAPVDTMHYFINDVAKIKENMAELRVHAA